MKGKLMVLSVLGIGLLAACARTDSVAGDKLPDVRLPTYSAKQSPSLASCPARRCLTAYVAPWCHYCRESTPMLIALRDYLRGHGVETRFVVGKDSLPALRGYAQTFGPDTMLDVHDDVEVGGVPHFYVSDDKGFILKDIAGVPAGAAGLSLEEVAAAFGLP
jgi:hypothetical protein